MSDMPLLYGALILVVVLVIEFFILADRVGAIKAFGREPLQNKAFLALGAASLLPGAGFFASVKLSALVWGPDPFNWMLSAMSMALIGGCASAAMTVLRVWSAPAEG